VQEPGVTTLGNNMGLNDMLRSRRNYQLINLQAGPAGNSYDSMSAMFDRERLVRIP
jgi:hypothetical protein